MRAIETLLTGIIDYAGLFPPASLDMETAVRNYRAYLRGEYAWMLGNFVLPASKLREFSEAFERVCCDEQEPPWTLSVVCTQVDPRDDVKVIDEFQEGAALLSAFEAKAIHDAGAWNVLALLGGERARYIEFPPEEADRVLPILRQYGARAKLRTGGIKAETIPPAETIIRFIRACDKARVPLKFTAGLHHAVRGVRKLIYALSSPTATMHGFLNVFVAAGLARTGAVEETLMKILAEEDPAAFQCEEDSIAWRNERLSVEQIGGLRAHLATGFGSCSFTEPIDDLKAMGWL
ncbi:MAG: hypothetical protein WA294_13705 [Acidobacteriaceae bacterium]